MTPFGNNCFLFVALQMFLGGDLENGFAEIND